MASELGLHCLPITLLRISSKEWAKGKTTELHMETLCFLKNIAAYDLKVGRCTILHNVHLTDIMFLAAFRLNKTKAVFSSPEFLV